MIKLMLIIFLIIIFILSTVSLFTKNWLTNMPKQVGLWKLCNPCINWDQNIASLNTLRASTIIMCVASLLSLVSVYLIPSKNNQKNVIRGSLAVVILCSIINLSVTPLLKKDIEKDNEKPIKLNFGYSYYLQILILIIALIILGLTFYKKNKVQQSPQVDFDESAWV